MARTWRWLRPRLTEKNLGIFLVVFFIGMTVWIAAEPYDPMKMDLADATTNEIWSDLIKEGKYSITIQEWRALGYPPTQSSVVNMSGQLYVVNEKGPAHAMFVAALKTVGLQGLTGLLCAGLAVFSTYMLGRRLFNWKVGFLAAILVQTNLIVVIMWHRYLWTDTSTMHFLIFGAWLLVESIHLFGKAHETGNPTSSYGAIGLGILGGLAFGFSIATRYPVALVLVAFVLYAMAKEWSRLSGVKKDPKRLVKWLGGTARNVFPFAIGLLIVLLPLMSYNTTYFGGPFRSGYDETSLVEFSRNNDLQVRNQSVQWSQDVAEGIGYIANNTVTLTPVFLVKMPLLILVPFAIVALRRRPELMLMLPWVLIIFLTYLSLPWVSMYAHVIEVPWEPRYFMPALPPLAIFAAFTLDRLGLQRAPDRVTGPPGKRRLLRGDVEGGKVFFVASVVFVLALSGLVPAENHFKELRSGQTGKFMPQGGPGSVPSGPNNPGNNPHQLPPGAILKEVPLQELVQNPLPYVMVPGAPNMTFVRVSGVTVSAVDFPYLNITDGQRTVEVRLDSFPQAPPSAKVGTRVNVQGPWVGNDRNRNGLADLGEFAINIKDGSADRLEPAQ